jgi:group II intron reverse transcriptase/maturase
MMNGSGKSDRPIVPTKPPNKPGRPEAEAVEGRGLAKGNMGQQNAPRTQSRKQGAPSALDRVRGAARRNRKERFTALMHHVTIDLLRKSFRAIKRDAAAGVDGVTWEQYAGRLEDNLRELHERLRAGAYRAKASRRVYIPKADGRQRPLGIATLEDKIVQRSVVEVLDAIYEVDFLGFSYGFRPGRGQHDALDALFTGIRRKEVSWVLDADLRDYFGSMSHEWLVKFIEHRIGDRRVIRLVQKWLKAGVLEEGVRVVSDDGVPQGAAVSPLLANIYAHYVLDLWVQQWRGRHARGDVVMVRFADDFVMGFQYRSDAESCLAALRERLEQFSLELHPDKTRLIEFGRYAAANRARRGQRRPETFDFLGFTHACGKTRKGRFQVHRRTIRKRARVKLREINSELRRRRHQPVPEQGRWLGAVVRGHVNYYAVPGNGDLVARFRTECIKHWRKALRQRSHKSRVTWDRINRLARRWLPPARICHPWPDTRFDARTRGRSPVR